MTSPHTVGVRALLVPQDIRYQMHGVVLPELHKTLPAMYALIGCSFVERVSCLVLPMSRLWVDEEGGLQRVEFGGKRSPLLNVRASILAGQPIRGNVIVCGEDIHGAMVDLVVEREDEVLDIIQISAEELVFDRRTQGTLNESI
jgi:hypothetical protein